MRTLMLLALALILQLGSPNLARALDTQSDSTQAADSNDSNGDTSSVLVQKLLQQVRELKAADTAKSGFDSEGVREKLFARPAAKVWDCNPDQGGHSPAPTCSKNCLNCTSNGQCYSYGQDYCGPRANCAVHCLNRTSNGQCYSYGPDFCGPRANCTENCLNRTSNGQCYSYGPDVCY